MKLKNLAEYRKTAVAAVGFAATVAVQMFAPDTWQWKLAAAVLAAGAAYGVWRVPNRPAQ